MLVRDQVLRRDSTRRPYFGSVGIMGPTQISRSRFKQSRISPHISHIYVIGCKFWKDFWVYLGITVFLKGLETFMKIIATLSSISSAKNLPANVIKISAVILYLARDKPDSNKPEKINISLLSGCCQ